MKLNLINIILNSSIAYIAGLITLLISFLVKIILVRLITPEDLGLFFNFQIYISLLVFLCSLCLNDYLIKNINNLRNNGFGLLLEVLLISAVSTIFILLIFALYYFYINLNNINILAFSIICIYIPIKIFVDILGSYFQSKGMLFIKIIYIDLLNQAIFLLILAIGIITSINNRDYIYLAYLTPIIITLIILLKKIIKEIPKEIGITSLKKNIAKFSIPLYLAGFMSYPLQLLPIYLSEIYDPSLSAYFGLAMSLSSLIFLGVSVTESASFAVYSNLVLKNRKIAIIKNFKFTTKWIALICSIIFCPLFIMPEIIVITLFKEIYIDVANILPALAFIYLFNVLFGPSESILKSYNNTIVITYSRLFIGLSALLTGYYFVKQWGLWGAIYSYGIAVVVSVACYSSFLYLKYAIHPISKNYIFTIFAIFNSVLITCELKNLLGFLNGSILTVPIIMISYIFLLFLNLYFFPIISRYDKVIGSRIFGLLREKFTK